MTRLAARPPPRTPLPEQADSNGGGGKGGGGGYNRHHYILINLLLSQQRSNYNLFYDVARCETGVDGKEGDRGGRKLQSETRRRRRSGRGEIFKVSRNEVGGNTSRADIVKKKEEKKTL